MFDESKISFEYEAKVDVRDRFFQAYNKRVWDSFKLYKANQNLKLPKGTFRFNNEDVNNKITLIGLTITPESVLYPSEVTETKVFKFIGQAGLDIYLCRNDSLKGHPCSSDNADLSFSTQTIKPTLTYWFNDSMIEIQAKALIPDKEDYSRQNKGGIASLVDLKEGIISLSLSDRIVNELEEEGFQLSKHYLINGFRANILSRAFASFKLCSNSFDNYIQYYLKLPKQILQTNLNMECK